MTSFAHKDEKKIKFTKCGIFVRITGRKCPNCGHAYVYEQRILFCVYDVVSMETLSLKNKDNLNLRSTIFMCL